MDLEIGYDGTIVHNLIRGSVQLRPYLAGGAEAKTYSPDIDHDKWRLINNDHIGDGEFFFIVAFPADAEIPDKIRVEHSDWADRTASGQVDINRAGGIDIGGFADPSRMAAAFVKLRRNPYTDRWESNEKFLLILDDAGQPEGGTVLRLIVPDERPGTRPDNAALLGW
jgi:hypothetical protein